MNIVYRASVVKAMEMLARCINDEEIFEDWLIRGVADGDLTPTPADEDWNNEHGLGYYIQDEEFARLMREFVEIMKFACKSGGLYADGISSGYEI